MSSVQTRHSFARPFQTYGRGIQSQPLRFGINLRNLVRPFRDRPEFRFAVFLVLLLHAQKNMVSSEAYFSLFPQEFVKISLISACAAFSLSLLSEIALTS